MDTFVDTFCDLIFVNIFCQTIMWKYLANFFVDTFCRHVLWTLFVDTFCVHFLWTLFLKHFLDTFWILFVKIVLVLFGYFMNIFKKSAHLSISLNVCLCVSVCPSVPFLRYHLNVLLSPLPKV